jgi:23S rRNA pseudouridine1911/1915/1917 synthase
VRWIARPGDGSRVRDVLARAAGGADEAAVAEGRVFVGRRRVRSGDEAVRVGDVVEVAPPRKEPARPVILLETDDLVAVDKPAGIPTIADHGGAAHALVAAVARELGVEASRLHPTSRLDRDVSGVVFFARTAAAAERLAAARRDGTYERRYLALAARSPDPGAGVWDAPIGRARDPRLRQVRGVDPVPARTSYAVTARSPRGEALLAVAPETGRTHQIRVHAANAGAPLLGDRDYGGAVRVTFPTGRVVEVGRVALHAFRVGVPGHAGRPLVAIAPVPRVLADLWAALGGEAAAWQRAAECVLLASPSP